MRPNYTAGGLLSARDLNDEQDYRFQRLRRHDRFAHGTGIVCGLNVYAAPQRLQPWTVGVCPGYAVSPCGDEIEVAKRTLIDIRNYFWSRPNVNGVATRAAFVGLRYSGDAAQPGIAGCGCGCATSGEETPARIHDTWAVDIVWLFERDDVAFDFCGGGTAPCPPAPSSAYVILAAVRLPAAESTPLSDADILGF